MSEALGTSSSEFIYKPSEERLGKLTIFHGNLQTFLDGDVKNATLLDISFVPDAFKLVVKNFRNGNFAPFAYENLDKDICKLYLNKLKQSNREGPIPPIVVNDKFELAQFNEMPDELKPFIGTLVKTVSNIHALVSSPTEGIFVTQTKYIAPLDEIMPIFERWSGQRSEFDPNMRADYTIGKNELIVSS